MNPDDLFADFVAAVKSLWPRYNTSEAELRVAVWDPKIRYYVREDVASVLRGHRSEDPDALRPNWKMIIRRLVEKHRSTDEFDVFLRNFRREMRRLGWVAESNEWTDEEVWQSFIDANTHPITHDLFPDKPPGSLRQTYSRDPKPDPDGRLAKQTKDRRELLQREWLAYFGEVGQTPPLFLAQAV